MQAEYTLFLRFGSSYRAIVSSDVWGSGSDLASATLNGPVEFMDFSSVLAGLGDQHTE